MNKEITIIEEQVKKCIVATNNIVVTNQEEYDSAYELGKKVSKLLKGIDEKEKAITKPINDSLKQIRDMFRPFKEQVEAEKVNIGKKLNEYIQAEELKKKLAEEKITARLEKGTIKEETAIRKLEEVENKAPETSGKTTSVLTVKLVDITKVDAKYLILNEALIKEDYRSGKTIDGVICEYETRTRF